MQITMTEQEAFDKVARHLLTQNAKSTVPREPTPWNRTMVGCAYRGDEGRQCAAGCLIPDELYKPEYERKVVQALFYNDTPLFCKEILPLVAALQHIHDHSDVSEWRRELRLLAIKYKLNPCITDTTP